MSTDYKRAQTWEKEDDANQRLRVTGWFKGSYG